MHAQATPHLSSLRQWQQRSQRPQRLQFKPVSAQPALSSLQREHTLQGYSIPGLLRDGRELCQQVTSLVTLGSKRLSCCCPSVCQRTLQH